VALAQVRAGPCQLVRPDRAGFPLPVFGLEAGPRALPCWLVAPAPRGRCGKGPREVSVPALFACSASALARGCVGTLDEATRGDNSLHRRNVVKGGKCVKQDETAPLPDPWYGL
jgi:hypothetical protein